jgi:hypothetical protein
MPSATFARLTVVSSQELVLAPRWVRQDREDCVVGGCRSKFSVWTEHG